MIHVVLDTNIYSANRRRDSGPFNALVRLCQGGIVKLHIPYVVKHEFLSQQKEQASKLIGTISEAAERLKDITSEPVISEFAPRVEAEAEKLAQNVTALVEKEWEQWVKRARALEHSVGGSHGERVINDYLVGRLPFKTAKNRNDLPDSFVWQAIRDFVEEFQTIYLVTNDKAFSAAAAEFKGIRLYDRLAALIEVEEFQKALRDLAEDVVAKNMRHTGDLLRSVKQKLISVVKESIEGAFAFEEVIDPRIPSENHDAIIYFVEEPSDLDLDFDKIDYYGDSEMGVPFEAIVICTVNYAISKSDFHALSQRRQAQISVTERNDYAYDADEEYPVRTTGTLQIKLDAQRLRKKEITDQEIRELFEDANYGLNIDGVAIV